MNVDLRLVMVGRGHLRYPNYISSRKYEEQGNGNGLDVVDTRIESSADAVNCVR